MEDFFYAHPTMSLIVGAKASGKSATAHYMLEHYATVNKIRAGFFAPQKVRENPDKYFKGGKPAWMEFHGRQIQHDCVTLIDDAQLMAHTREWHRNVALDKILTLSRHEDWSIIYTTQQTVRLDKNIFADVDCMVFKRPALIAEHTERPFMRKINIMLNKEFDNYEATHPDLDMRSMSYVISNQPRYEGWIGPTGLPSYWTEELSKW